MKFVSALAVCLALLLFVACGGDSPTETPAPPVATAAPTQRPIVVPTTPPGWTPYSRSTYQIALPDSWQEIKLDKDSLTRAITDAQNSNPPLADQLNSLLDSGQAQAFVFYATDENAGPIPPSVSVARVPFEGTNDIQGYMKSYADALPNIVRGSKVVEVQAPLKVNNIDAAEIVYDVSLVDNGGTLTTLRGVQFLYVLESGDAYLITLTGDASTADTFMPLARQIGTSFVGVAR